MLANKNIVIHYSSLLGLEHYLMLPDTTLILKMH